ncbi:MAG: sulfatase-like hydrolase/transferase [Deltaproteobacteria bacterium]|nr:sulfatase-like hydrolase/transferase [Deltaproteobacteria bacterium]
MKDRSIWLQGLLSGLAWGAAVATAHLGHGIGLILVLGQPPLTWFAAKGTLIEGVIGVVGGLLLSPVFKLPRGHVIHPVLLTFAWLIMERLVAVDPSKPAMWLAPSVVGLVLYGMGARAWKRAPRATVAVAAALPVALLAAPEIRTALQPEPVVHVDRGTARPDAPDVLFLVMDTVRAQSSSAYGYGRKTTPNLEKIAAEGVLFELATAPGTWSLPAHAALFTGTFPSYNNAHEETRYLDEKLPTIAETFAKAGYETLCFSANPHVSDAFGLTRGFSYSDKAWMSGPGARQFSFIYRTLDYFELGVVDKGGAEVVGNVERWLDDRPEDGPPAFVFVNFLEAHFPFHQLPHDFVYAFQDRSMNELREAGQIGFGVQFGRQLTQAEQDQIRGPLVDLYDGGVLYTDHLIGQVVDQWRQRGLLDDTIVVVLADHGEVVGEHGAFGHVTPMVEEVLRVPLVFRYPKKIEAGRRVAQPVSSVGTFATLAELADVPMTADIVQVGSLLSAMEGDDTAGKPIIAERFEEHLLASRFAPGTANGTGPLVNPYGRFRSIRSGDLKYVLHDSGDATLYDLATDPGETTDLAETRPDLAIPMAGELEVVRTAIGLPPLDAEILGAQAKQMDDHTRAMLESLGYLTPEEE